MIQKYHNRLLLVNWLCSRLLANNSPTPIVITSSCNSESLKSNINKIRITISITFTVKSVNVTDIVIIISLYAFLSSGRLECFHFSTRRSSFPCKKSALACSMSFHGWPHYGHHGIFQAIVWRCRVSQRVWCRRGYLSLQRGTPVGSVGRKCQRLKNPSPRCQSR